MQVNHIFHFFKVEIHESIATWVLDICKCFFKFLKWPPTFLYIFQEIKIFTIGLTTSSYFFVYTLLFFHLLKDEMGHSSRACNNHWKQWAVSFVFKFFAKHIIYNVIHNDELEEFNTIEMVVTKIHGKSAKFFNYNYIYGDDVEEF